MFAKVVGIVTAVAVLFIYFTWRSTDPVMETAIGMLLAAAVGFWAWWATARRLLRQDAPPADAAGELQPPRRDDDRGA